MSGLAFRCSPLRKLRSNVARARVLHADVLDLKEEEDEGLDPAGEPGPVND